jgi:tRNA threonylcarbamoyladenosine biosynthesis protein TsaE
MSMTVTCKSAYETRAFAEYLGTFLAANDVLLLSGDLGAGKTEFAKGVASAFGITEAVNSPTFNLLLVHEIKPERAEQAGWVGQLEPAERSEQAMQLDSAELPANRLRKSPHSLYHFDLYRLDSADQLDDLDYFGLLEDGALSVVEWGDRFSDALPNDYLLITITSQVDEQRTIRIDSIGPRSTQILEHLQE